jgi:hypothetical protein
MSLPLSVWMFSLQAQPQNKTLSMNYLPILLGPRILKFHWLLTLGAQRELVFLITVFPGHSHTYRYRVLRIEYVGYRTVDSAFLPTIAGTGANTARHSAESFSTVFSVRLRSVPYPLPTSSAVPACVLRHYKA